MTKINIEDYAEWLGAARGGLWSFTVEGRGPFPVDMLRYDCAWPVDTHAAAKLAQDVPQALERRVVDMRCIGPRGPTVERWRSFGWSVLRRDEADDAGEAEA